MASRAATSQRPHPGTRECLWEVTAPGATEAVPTSFAGGIVLRWGARRTEALGFYDTYDWDLAFAGLALVRRGRMARLCPAGHWQARTALARQALPCPPRPGLPLDLPDGALAEALGERVGCRRLLPAGTVCCRVTPGTVHAAGGVLLGHIASEAYEPLPGSGRAPFTLVRWRPAGPRGQRLAAVDKGLTAAGLMRLGRADLRALPARLLAVPAREALRPRVRASARGPARTVVLSLALALLAAMRRYEDGIRRGLDPECLHQYRVLLRRLRSLVSQMRRVLPDAVTGALRESLRDLARRTGRLRDLDVLLLAEPAYRRMVPEALQPPLSKAFLAARRRRGLERGRFVLYLRSSRYAARMAALQQVIALALEDTLPVEAGVPIGRLVRKRLRRQYRRIRREAAELPGTAPDAAYHRIRIRCKRVRYLLDLFQEVLCGGPAAVLLKRLQALQEVLGAVNDLAVQRGHLEGLLAAGSGAPAMTNLWRRLGRRRELLDRRVRVLLCRLCHPSTAQALKRL